MLLTGLIAAIPVSIVSFFLCTLAIKFGPEDSPDGLRKLQEHPISRGGGVAIAAVLLLGIVILKLTGDTSVQNPTVLNVIALCTSFFLVGLWDDLKPPPAILKLGVLTMLIAIFILSGNYSAAITTPLGSIEMPLVLMIGSGFWLLVFGNATNFMDGSNGLMAGCIAIMMTGFAIIFLFDYTFVIFPMPLIIYSLFLGAVLGFLIHNLRGKLYAGDAGSLGLGALFASLGLVSGVQVWTVATLALPFLIDVLMTLIWREKHGRPWLQPHLDHAYQKLRLSGWSHIETAFLYWGLSIVCAISAVIAAKADGDAPFFVFWGLCLSGIILWSAHRRGHPAQ
ncbi:MAG: hypothetical protein AAGI14_02150 [Pseudomonadota bacterium]